MTVNAHTMLELADWFEALPIPEPPAINISSAAPGLEITIDRKHRDIVVSALRSAALPPSQEVPAPPQTAREVTDEMINAAAREIWNDRDARHGGAWDSRDPMEVCVIQTKATARAALKAAIAQPQCERDALGYATRLLEHFVAEHFPHNPDWKPLPDLIGVLTQLDNVMTIARDYKEKLRAYEGPAHTRPDSETP